MLRAFNYGTDDKEVFGLDICFDKNCMMDII
jgi:hypothetical protein